MGPTGWQEESGKGAAARRRANPEPGFFSQRRKPDSPKRTGTQPRPGRATEPGKLSGAERARIARDLHHIGQWLTVVKLELESWSNDLRRGNVPDAFDGRVADLLQQIRKAMTDLTQVVMHLESEPRDTRGEAAGHKQ
jgi:signal transduction histidine kinase